ncbi:unnamed protein product [Chrysodeixis includens]|uniref:Uncharacterized protein n=1 Tax=Chrysodeixis includens TaxID=689277 RepID=A0A9N8KZ34_CHRIL|nr:unnamed protein product [Chrysodeixis includens]
MIMYEIPRTEVEQDLECSRDRMQRQEKHLENAREIASYNTKRAKKLMEGIDKWRIFQMSLWNRDFTEASQAALAALHDTCSHNPDTMKRFAALIATTDLESYITKNQRRLSLFVQKILAEQLDIDKKESCVELAELSCCPNMSAYLCIESVFSPSVSSVKSGVSIASGYTRRLAGFRRQLAPKVEENALVDEIPETARRSTVSLRVITLNLEEACSMTMAEPTPRVSKRSMR